MSPWHLHLNVSQEHIPTASDLRRPSSSTKPGPPLVVGLTVHPETLKSTWTFLILSFLCIKSSPIQIIFPSEIPFTSAHFFICITNTYPIEAKTAKLNRAPRPQGSKDKVQNHLPKLWAFFWFLKTPILIPVFTYETPTALVSPTWPAPPSSWGSQLLPLNTHQKRSW